MLESFLNGLMFGLGLFTATFVFSLLFLRFGRKFIIGMLSKLILTLTPTEIKCEPWREREENESVRENP